MEIKLIFLPRPKDFQYTKVNEKSLYSSYLIILRISKAGSPHTIGETLVFPAIKDTVKVFFDDKSEKEIEKIPVSNNTVTRRIDEMSQCIENQLIQRVHENTFFSLQLDESTDVQGLCQLQYLYLCVIYGTLNLMKICCSVNQSVEVPVMKFLRLLILMPKQKVLIGINVWEYVRTAHGLCVVETVLDKFPRRKLPRCKFCIFCICCN